MLPSKPVRVPLTVVGIVSNVLALVLVCVLLNADAQSSKMLLRNLAVSIIRMAKTGQMSGEDMLKEFGKPELTWVTDRGWTGRWHVSINDIATTSDTIYQITVDYSPHKTANGQYAYRVDIAVVQTWRSGLKYLQANLARALSTGSLFPFLPHLETEGDRLVLPLPTGKLVP